MGFSNPASPFANTLTPTFGGTPIKPGEEYGGFSGNPQIGGNTTPTVSQGNATALTAGNTQANGVFESLRQIYTHPAYAQQNSTYGRDIAGFTEGANQITETGADIRDDQMTAAEYALGQYIGGGAQAETAKRQQEYYNYLMGIINNTNAPSAAQQQLRQALEANQQKTASTIASQRGMNTMTAARLAAQEQGQAAQAMAGKAAEIRATEVGKAQEQVGQLLRDTRSLDIEASSRMADSVNKLQEAVRTGDQNAMNAAIQEMQSQRQYDIQNRQLTIDQQKADQNIALEQAKLAFEQERLRLQNEVDAGRLTLEEKKAAEATFWKWVSTIAIVAGTAGLAIAMPAAAPAIIAAGAAAVGGVHAALGEAVKQGSATPAQTKPAETAAAAPAPTNAFDGGRIKGKAKVKGDNKENDTVPALLSPGEIVIPRSIAQSSDAAQKSKKFVEAIQKLEDNAPQSKKGIAKKIADLEAEVAALKSKKKGNK